MFGREIHVGEADTEFCKAIIRRSMEIIGMTKTDPLIPADKKISQPMF